MELGVEIVGRVMRDGQAYGNCLRKTYYYMMGIAAPEVPDLVVLANKAMALYYDRGEDHATVIRDGVYFRPRVKIIDGKWELWQAVWGQMGSDIASDEHMPYTRFFANFSWYPVVHLWLLQTSGIKELNWKIFNIEGGVATLKLGIDSRGMITSNGSATTMSIRDAEAGMAPIIEMLKSSGPLPPRDFLLIRPKNQMSKLVGNTMSSTRRSTATSTSIPRDFSLPYLIRPLHTQHLRGREVVDNFGRYGDHECRTCPYQKTCYAIEERFPTAGRRKNPTRATLAVIRQRMLDAPRPTLFSIGSAKSLEQEELGSRITIPEDPKDHKSKGC